MEKSGVKDKKAQLKLSFGMIFSIILIIVFITVAFYGIRTFLNLQDTAQIATFTSDLNSDVDSVWKSTQSSQRQEYFVPSKVSHVCFIDFAIPAKGANSFFYDDLKRSYFGSENLVFYPFGSTEKGSAEIKNIDIEATTQSENPFCIQNVDGVVELTLVKNFSDALVTVKR